MFDYSEAQIEKILIQYKNKREKEKERYNKIKDTEEYRTKSRERAKKNYNETKEIRKEKYNNNKFMNLSKNSFYYYKKRDNIEKFKTKFPDRYDALLLSGYIQE
jgi:hypothetical protein